METLGRRADAGRRGRLLRIGLPSPTPYGKIGTDECQATHRPGAASAEVKWIARTLSRKCCVPLLARLSLLDQAISEQASRTEVVRERGWNATTFERRSKLLKTTRGHYVALLKLLLVEGKCPILWNDLDPDAAADSPQQTP